MASMENNIIDLIWQLSTMLDVYSVYNNNKSSIIVKAPAVGTVNDGFNNKTPKLDHYHHCAGNKMLHNVCACKSSPCDTIEPDDIRAD